ncbi:hypothetical protein ACHAW5_009200 [Stephanodiscus triporus]|uniref:Fibronectin type-III domain-containing protein n=1 Tax=Stephanodiscus triporus TaxID=2934178 RepID=A0ABD3NAK1_9STRA
MPGHRGGHGLVVFVARGGDGGTATTTITPGFPSGSSQATTRYALDADDGYYDVHNAREHPSNEDAEMESRRKAYVVPGDMGRAPYVRTVTIKAWGGGGGGCDGGRGETEEREDIDDDEIANLGEGHGGSYVEATFLLPVGEALRVFVGGGGGSSSSAPNSLGGRGGLGGGRPGRDDGSSGGGGGGGYSSVRLSNGTVLVSAYGGDGGGNASYCSALGGRGGRPSTGRGGMEEEEDAGGYVDLDLALRSSSLDDRVVATCLGAPAIVSLSHDSASFLWDAGACQRERSKELYVQKYSVRISSASGDDVGRDSGGTTKACPDDIDEYRPLKHIQRGIDVNRNATTVAADLRPSTRYCLRIEAFSIRGLSLGVRILPFATKPEPINEWLPVTVRQLDVTVRDAGVTINDGDVSTTTAETSTTWCEHSSTRPSGRRGHSMTVIDDQVYIFGGATIKCVCKRQVIDREETRACSSKAVYSNELWHYDPTTSLFTQLGWKSEEAEEEEESPWPRGREQHSMTALPNGYLVLVGGVSSSNEDFAIGKEANVLLKDVWTMRDPRRVIPNLVFSSDNNAIDLIPGHVTSHVMPVSLRDEVHGISVGEEDMCINRLTVKFSFDHICPNGIQYIKLTGPGTAARGTADHDAPQSRDYETKVFVSSIESREKECQHSTSLDLLMSDDAEDWVLSHASIPKSGTFRPASSLAATFGGLPIDGEWKISVSMESSVFYPEESRGRLLDWELKIDAKPCAAGRPRWQKLPSPPSDFSERRLHTAVAVGNSIFFTGGFAKQQLNDMWRFDFDTNLWTDLTQLAVVEHGRHLPLYGQASFLGPFGLLSYGGMTKHVTRNKGLDLFLLNLFEGDWVSVPIRQHDSTHDYGRFRRVQVALAPFFVHQSFHLTLCLFFGCIQR